MTDVTITNAEVLTASRTLREAKATNALASVKLAKLRRAIEAEATIVREAFDAAARALSGKDADGNPIQQRAPGGAPLFLVSTGTPAYEFAPDPAAAFDLEVAPLFAASVTISIAPLTATDLAAISLIDDQGDALLPFVAID